jgi:hypothetical protein
VHPENFYYSILVTSNATGQTVYSNSSTTFSVAEVTPSLAVGTYTATVTPYNKAGTAGTPASSQFDVVIVSVQSPTGDIQEGRPTIRWTEVLESKSYRVNIRSLTTGAVLVLTEFDTAGLAIPNEYKVATTLPLGRYEVMIQAKDQAGQWGDSSAPARFQVRTAPTVVVPGTVIVPRPVLSWTGVPGATSYEIELFNLTDNVVVRTVSGIAGTSWTPTADLTLGQYRFTVRGFNVAGDSSTWSTPAVFGYAPSLNVTSPVNGARLPDSTPTFVWSLVPSADYYELVVNQNYGSGAEVFRAGNIRTNSFTRTTEVPIGKYRYTVRAVNEAATGSVSGDYSALSVVYGVTITEPPVIVNPPATTFLTRPDVTWTVPVGAGVDALSDIWINKVEGTSSSVYLKASRVSGTAWKATSDLVLGTYQLWIRTYSAVDASVVSDWSLQKTFRVTTPPTLIGPTGRTDDATPTLTWEGVQGAQSYRVYVSSMSTGGTALYDVSGLNALNFTVPKDLPIGRYRFWAQARSAFGDVSNWSVQNDFQVVSAPVLAGPSSATFDTTPTFSWSDMSAMLNGTIPAGATSYDFRLDQVLATSVVENFKFRNTTATTVTIPDAEALPTGIYRAYVRARSADTQGDYTKFLEFFVGGRPKLNSIPTSANKRPTFSWGNVDGASTYEIYVVNVADTSKVVVRQSGISTTAYTPTVDLGKGTFRVWARAFNSGTGAASLWSVPVDFTITATDVLLPTGNEGSWIATALASVFEPSASDISVSMIRSEVVGAAAVREVMPVVEAEASAVPMTEQVVPVNEADALQNDAVLSAWDQEIWWEQKSEQAALQAVPVVADRAEPQSASVGVLGALLGLVSLRRRRREEESAN